MSDEGFVIDFSEIPDLGPIPQGQYLASVVKVTPGKAQSGYGKIQLQWRIEEGEYEGRSVFDTLTWHPDGLPFTKAKLLALGWQAGFSGHLDPEELEGITTEIQVIVAQSKEVDPNTGEPYPPQNRVKKILQI